MLRLLLLAPVLLLLIVFALSNPQPVRLGLWPTDLAVEVPVSLAVLVGAGLAFFIGGLVAWSGSAGLRRKLARAQGSTQVLEAQLRSLRAQQQTAVVSLPPPAE